MKKNIFYFLVLAVMAFFLCLNITDARNNVQPQITWGNIDKSIFSLFEDLDAVEIENRIRKAEKDRFEKYGGSTQKQITDTLFKLKSGEVSLRQVFAGTFVAGDSLMNGLEIYGVLSPDNLATQVSASLYHLSDNLGRIISANPEVLIIHYGVNMISAEKGQLEYFIESYSVLINKLKVSLPFTRIIISGLFPVDKSVAQDANLKLIPEYNAALLKMCEELGVEFLDSTPAFEGNSDYYGADGIHLHSGFYSDVWLPFIIKSKGIIG